MINEHEFENEEILETEIPFSDKRRFTDEGDIVELEIDRIPEDHELPADPVVVKLENTLNEMTIRCEAAESKLREVQVRFEAETTKLDTETAERRERMKKSLEQRADQSRFNFLIALLPVLDNLNLAISSSEQDSSFENLIEGVKGTAKSFAQALFNVGVNAIEAKGELFDPELHEAVDLIEVGEEDEGKVIAEYALGYTYKDRLLRPTKVQVGKVEIAKKHQSE